MACCTVCDLNVLGKHAAFGNPAGAEHQEIEETLRKHDNALNFIYFV
jgi:hypothetical protein